MYSHEERFVWDIDALIQSVEKPIAPNLLDASVRLRRLLTDDPLLHKVSRRKFKPRFRVLDHKHEKPPMISGHAPAFHWTRPDPSFAPHLQTKETGLDGFLAQYMASAHGHDLTIKAMINYVANVGGGVHQGEPKNDSAKAIHANAKDIIINGLPYPLASLIPVINIVIEALMPLYNQIKVLNPTLEPK